MIPSSSSSYSPSSMGIQAREEASHRMTTDQLCTSACSELPLHGRLCFLPSGAQIVFVEDLESHINSLGTRQQPPSSSEVTWSSPEITQGFREQKGLHRQDALTEMEKHLHPCSQALPYSPLQALPSRLSQSLSPILQRTSLKIKEGLFSS